MSRSDRIKVAVTLPIIALCTLWIGYRILSGFSWPGSGAPVETPGSTIAIEVSNKLLERQEFNDTGVIVLTEQPLKFQIIGAVRSQQDLVELDQYLKELRPDLDYEMNVSAPP